MKKVMIFLPYILCLFIILTSCHSITLQEYYSEKDNYVYASGTVIYISYSEEGDTLYLSFSDLTPSFDDICFKIVGENLTIVQNNGFDEQVKVGDTIKFVSAPKYFGDGYVMPIVSISKDEMIFLEFEEGFKNFSKWIEDNY